MGDSRLYRRRDGVMKQLTEDHSLLNDYIKMKHLSPDEIAAFPHKNVIVRALGMKDTVQVDVHMDTPRMDDLYRSTTPSLRLTVGPRVLFVRPPRHDAHVALAGPRPPTLLSAPPGDTMEAAR